jgi:hypothetical protein
MMRSFPGGRRVPPACRTDRESQRMIETSWPYIATTPLAFVHAPLLALAP